MFCPNCKKEIPDNSAFCSECGEPIVAPIPESAPTATPTVPVKKIQYFTKVAPKNKRILAGVALAFGILCILFVFLSANNTVNGSFFDLPIVSIFDLDDDEFNQLEKDLDEAVKVIEEADNDEIKEILSNILKVPVREIKDPESEREKILDLLTPFSLNSTLVLSEEYSMAPSEDSDLISTVITGIWIIAAFLILLTALGVFFMKTWIMVLSYILGVLFVILTGGFVYFILTTVAYITTAVLFSKMKRHYKAYKAACVTNI